MPEKEKYELVPLKTTLQSIYPENIEFPLFYRKSKGKFDLIYKTLRRACLSLEQSGWHYYHTDPVQDMRAVLTDALSSELRADALLYVIGLSPNSPGKKIKREEAIQKVQQESGIKDIGFTQPSEAIGLTALKEVYGAHIQLPPEIKDTWVADTTQAGIPYAKKRAEIARIARIYPDLFKEIQYYFPDTADKFLQFYRFGPHEQHPYHNIRLGTIGIKNSRADWVYIYQIEAFIEKQYDYCGFQEVKTIKHTDKLSSEKRDYEANLGSAAYKIRKEMQRDQINKLVESKAIDEVGLTQLQKEIVTKYNAIRQRTGKWVTEDQIEQEIVEDLRLRFPGHRFQRNEIAYLMHHVSNPGEEPKGERALHDVSYKYDIHRMLENKQTREASAKKLRDIMDKILRLYHTEGQLGTLDAIAYQCGMKFASVFAIKRFAEQMIQINQEQKMKNPKIYRDFIDFWPPDSGDFPDEILEVLNIYKDFNHNYTLGQAVRLFNEHHMPSNAEGANQERFVPMNKSYFQQILLYTMDRVPPRIHLDELSYRERQYYYRTYIANWLEPMRNQNPKVWERVQNLVGVTDEDIDVLTISSHPLANGQAPKLDNLDQLCKAQGISAGYDKIIRTMNRMKAAFGEIPPDIWQQMLEDSSLDKPNLNLIHGMPKEIFRYGR